MENVDSAIFKKFTCKFTNEQIQEFAEAFKEFQSKNKPYMRNEKIRDLLKCIGYNPQDVVLERHLVELDEDGNGRVNFVKFMELMAKLETNKKNLREAREAFNSFDFMGHGYVGANDVKEAILYVLKNASTKTKDDVISFYRLQENRRITFEEFQTMILYHD